MSDHKSFKNNSPLSGLSNEQAVQRLIEEGSNDLGLSQRRTLMTVMRDVLFEPMFLLLLAAGAIYLLTGDRNEAMVLLGFVLVIMTMTVFQERRTDNALAALRDLSSPRALVIRSGVEQRIAGHEVVREDVLILAEGDRVSVHRDLQSIGGLWQKANDFLGYPDWRICGAALTDGGLRSDS